MFGPQQPPTRKLPPPGASILFGKRFEEEEEEDPTQPVQAQQPEPRMPPPGASILFGSRFAPPEEEMVAPAPLPQAHDPNAFVGPPLPQSQLGMVAPDGLKGMPLPYGGSDINPMSMMDDPATAPDTQKPILPVSLASDGGSFENLAMMGMLPDAPLMDPNAQHPPPTQDVVAGPREMDNRWQGPPVPEEQTFKKPYADPISPSEMPVPMDQQRLGQPGSIGPSTPMDLRDAERAAALEKVFAGHGPVDRFMGSAVGQMVQIPIGLGAALNVKAMSDDEKRAAEAYLDFDRGLAGQLGRVAGVIVPPVTEIIFVKATAARLAPIVLAAGATKLAQFLKIVGTDPGKLLHNKEYAKMMAGLMGEELSFIAGDVLQGLDSKQVGLGMLFGLGAGFGVETVGAAFRAANAAGDAIPADLLQRLEVRAGELKAGDELFGSELAGMLDAARPAGRAVPVEDLAPDKVVSIDDLAPDPPARAEPREPQQDQLGPTKEQVEAERANRRGEDGPPLPPEEGPERNLAFKRLLEQGDVEDLEQLRTLAITDEEAFRIRKRIGALYAGRGTDETDRIFGAKPGDPEAREIFRNENVGELAFYGGGRPTASADQLQPTKQEVAAKRAQDRLDAERDIEEVTEQAREQAQYSQPRGPRERPEPVDRRSRPRTTQEERDRTAARLKKERERRQQAELSPVTGLPGRAIFDKAAARVAADPNQVVGLFDITNFKSINENLGWDEGDNILRRAAAAVQEAADEVGVSVRSRFHFGGDEFALTGDPALVAKAQERAKELFGVQKVGDFEVGFRHAQGGDFGQANKALDDVKAAETGAKFRNAKVPEVEEPYYWKRVEEMTDSELGRLWDDLDAPRSKRELGTLEIMNRQKRNNYNPKRDEAVDPSDTMSKEEIRKQNALEYRRQAGSKEPAPKERVEDPDAELEAEQRHDDGAQPDDDDIDDGFKMLAWNDPNVRAPLRMGELDRPSEPKVAEQPLWMKESEGLRSVGVTKPFGPETLDALNAAAKKGTFAEDVGQNLVDAFRDTRMSRRDVNDLGTELGIPDLAKKLIDNPEKATRELGNKWNDRWGKGQLDKPEPKGKVDVKDPDQVEEALRTNPKAAEELARDPEAGFLDLGTMVRDLSESRAGHAFRRWFYSAGDVDPITYRQKMDSDSRFKGAIRATTRTMEKIQGLIAKEFGVKNMDVTDQNLLDALNKHLSPSRERLSDGVALSDDLIMELRTLRGQVDALSTHLVTEGYVQGDLAATISNGLGTWLTRTYRQFDPAARATGWKHDPDAINGARNWAKRTLHADDDEATNFVNGLMSAGSFEDAWREITGRTMTIGPKQDRILQVRTGYVPQATRVKLEKHLTVNKKLSRNDVNDMVDAYIQRKPGDDRIIQELNKQANLLANDLDSLPIEKLDTPLARARSAQLDEIRRLSKELNERREIPEEIRALWGEESNPLVSALLSVHSAARQLEDYRLMKGMVEHGKEAGFVRSGKADILDTDEWVRMTPEVQRRMGAPIRSSATEDMSQGAERQFADPFAGDLYIQKEFVEAFEHRFMAGSYETVSGFGKVVRGLTWLVKGNMTFRSLPTHGRNFLGASYFQVLNGHIGIHNVGRHMMGTASAKPGTLTHAFLAGREGLRSKVFGSSEEWAKLMDEYTSLGIVDSSVRSREFQENLKEILGGSGDITDWLRNREGKLAKIGATLAKVDQLGQDLYRMEDDIAKIFFFENERIALETHWANYVKRGNKEGLQVPSKQQMKQEAAWLSQDLYANYDRLPRAIQELRKNPLVGSFPSFSWEVLRTGKNHFMRMSYELNHPVLWPRGLARLMGGAQVMAAFPAMQAALRLKNNISKEEQDAFQRSRGTYQEDNMLLILKKNDDGTYNYVDLSYTDPGDTWRTAAIAYSRDRKANPGQMWKSLGAGLSAGMAPFNQAEIVMSLYTDLTRNSDVFGRAISKEKGGRGPVAHSLRAVRPGTFRMVDRLWQAYTEEIQPNYTRLSKVGETIGAGGIRMEIGNPRADIYWKMGRWRGELIQTEGELNRKVESLNDDVTDRELLVTLQRLEDRRSNLFRQGGMSVQDARIMGIPDKDVAEMAKAMGLSKRDTKLVLANMYKPKVFGPTYKDQVIDASRKKAPGGALGNEVARRIEDRVKLLRRASAAISSQVEYFK